jgi:hypothetical protein
VSQSTQTDAQGYRNVGSVGQFPELQAICGAIFSRVMFFSLPDGTRLRTKLFKGTLFAVEHEGLRYVEQNPRTQSAYAKRARAGARILWVIRIARQIGDGSQERPLSWVSCNEWLGRIEDGLIWRK